MDGLEAVEVRLSDVFRENEDFRCDSEYFRKRFLNLDTVLSRLNGEPIESFAVVSDGDHSKFPENQNEEVRYLQAKDIKNYFLLEDNPVYIGKEYFDKNARSHITEENVLLSIMGSVGDLTITPKGFKPSIANRAIAIIRDIARFNPYFVFAYLITDEANLLIERLKTGGVQERVNLDVLRRLKVPHLSLVFQLQIEKSVKSAHLTFEQSKALYAEAERLLLAELGLQDWQSSEENVAVKSFRDSFGSAGRLDAEYYHPEKFHILHQLAKLPGKAIGDHFSVINDVLVPPTHDTGERVQNYDLTDALKFFLDEIGTMPTVELGSNKKRFKAGDLVVSRLRSYLKEIALVEQPTANCVGSTEFIVLRPRSERFAVELLLVYLRSFPVQTILKWCQEGSNHPRFNEVELVAIKLPDKLLRIQSQIQYTIREAVKTDKESKLLLEVAKRGVELAIEQDEAAALAWMAEQTAGKN